MIPIDFKERNAVFAENQPEYLPLPVYKDNEQGGRVFHCWKLSFVEKLKVMFTGKIWVNVLHFNKPLQPIKLMVKNPFKDKGGENV